MLARAALAVWPVVVQLWSAVVALAIALALVVWFGGATGCTPDSEWVRALPAPVRRLALRWEAERRMRRVWRSLETQLPRELTEEISTLSDEQISEAIVAALEPLLAVVDDQPALHLAIDIGGTRTKFMLRRGEGDEAVLEPMSSRALWQDDQLPGDDKFDPSRASARVRAHLEAAGVPLDEVRRVVFSVPGTVDIEALLPSSEPVQVRNMPSFSPRFRGFNFKAEFAHVFPAAKISAVPDNMAAALGVACIAPKVQNALVLVLGTAPAAATFFRDPTKRDKYVESAIWQSWVWFTKIDLRDRFGYCGGVHLGDDGRTLRLRAASEYKIPHHQARIRFALDSATWERLMGRSTVVPAELQGGGLSEDEATDVWCARLEDALSALALKFHSVYGPPEVVYVLGGNSVRCHGRVTSTSYEIPDSAKRLRQSVPVVIPRTDGEQQRVPLLGLLHSAKFKVKHVFAPGQDPLARGWTRGGELYIWVSRSSKRDEDKARSRTPSPARRQAAAAAAAAQTASRKLAEQLEWNASRRREQVESQASDSLALAPRALAAARRGGARPTVAAAGAAAAADIAVTTAAWG